MPNATRFEPGPAPWADLVTDLRDLLRGLRRHSTLTTVLVLVLALGIGAATATYTLVDALMLRPLPVSHPEHLIVIGDPTRTNSTSSGGPRVDLISYPLYADVRGVVPQVQAVAASSRAGRIDVLLPQEPGAGTPIAEHPTGRLVSANYFATLGVAAAIGRTFPSVHDQSPGDQPVAVLSHRYWIERFGGDSSIVGRSVVVNHVPLTVVGITPPGFDGEIVGQPTAIWIPIMMEPALIPARPWLDDRNTSSSLLIARLAPGTTIAQARSALNDAIHRDIQQHATAAEYAAQTAHDPVLVTPGARGVSAARSSYATALTTLMMAVMALLLLTIANAANLSLARVVASAPDTTVRAALGASRFRVMRQSLLEHLVIGVTAGILGLMLASIGSAALLALADPTHQAMVLDVRPNGRIIVFALATTLATAIAFGVVPTVRQLGNDPATALRGNGRGTAHGWGGGARALVVAQVAVSIALVAATAMLRQSLLRIQHVDTGFARGQIDVATVDLARSGIASDARDAVMQRLLLRVRSAPGIAAAAYSVNGMFGGAEADTTLQAEGFVARSAGDTVVKCDYVSPGFFAAIGARVIQGRDIEDRDDQQAPRVAVVNQSLAHFFFGGANAVGRRLMLGTTPYQVIGVVADIQSQRLRDPVARRIYTPVAQRFSPPGYITFEARSSSAARTVDPMRTALLAELPSLIILSNQPVDRVISGTLAQDRLLADVITFFGALALTLAGLGVYGVIANATARRAREFGVRLALGAQRRAVVMLVVREAIRLTGLGAIIGLPLVFATQALLRRQLFGVGPVDAVALLIACGGMLAVGVVAGVIPAVRVARLRPVEALK
jgi:predicted permease